ncbi:MAG: hypothetical protein AB1451_15085, partial [Nitrospirota bacterium]
GHLFQGRFKAIVVDKTSYLLELSRYIHLNPVRIRQPLALARYPWSSYWAYIGRRAAPAWLTRGAVLDEVGGRGPQAEQRYQAFVEDGAKAGVASPWARVVAQVALGDERFLASLRRRVPTAAHRELPSRRQLAKRPSWRAIERAVQAAAATLTALEPGRRRDPVRAVLVYVARERGGLSLREVARTIGREEATVSRLAGRVAARRRTDRRWDQAIARIEEGLAEPQRGPG